MSCEAANEIVMANRSGLAPSQTCKQPRPVWGRSIDEAKARGFHRGLGRNFTPYQRPDVWQQPDPFTLLAAWRQGAVHVWSVFHCQRTVRFR